MAANQSTVVGERSNSGIGWLKTSARSLRKAGAKRPQRRTPQPVDGGIVRVVGYDRPRLCSARQSRSVADLDATYSPAVGRPDPPRHQIATAVVVTVTGVAIGVVVSAVIAIGGSRKAETQTEADAKSGSAKSTAPETAAPETTTPKTATADTTEI